MCKEYTAPRSQKDSRPFASIDANQKIDPILNIEIALIVDVPGASTITEWSIALHMDFDKSW